MQNTGPNAQQIEHWNQIAGPKWVALQQFIDAQIRPHGEAAMQRAKLQAGDQVLDVGCGCGSTSLELARRVGADGSVMGIDISSVMLERARATARERGVANVDFVNADAQTHRFEPASRDVLFSRFGVMFFAQPEQAFANLATALRSGGRLAFVCWQAMSENPWVLVPLMAALQHIPPPSPPPAGAPGPFALADAARVQRILSQAGFQDVQVEALNQPMNIGQGYDLDQTIDLMMQMGPMAMVLRDAEPQLLQRVKASVRQAVLPYSVGDHLQLGAAAWVVSARRA
jgi:SAM-dependent methyltransferase